MSHDEPTLAEAKVELATCLQMINIEYMKILDLYERYSHANDNDSIDCHVDLSKLVTMSVDDLVCEVGAVIDELKADAPPGAVPELEDLMVEKPQWEEVLDRISEPLDVEHSRRVRLIHTSDKYTELKAGDEGTVSLVDDMGTVHVDWDKGSNLGLLPGVDTWENI